MRILLVEDDVMLGKATVAGLKTNYAVDWCQNAPDAELALRATDYDLAILDINLPGKSGLELLRDIRKAKDNRPVLFLTARDSVSHRIEGLNAGADDYLVKPFDLDELLARAAALIRRSRGNGASPITQGDVTYDPVSRAVSRNGENILLSARERAILEILMTNRGRTISKAQIEQHIYDWSSEDIESNTIEVHISSLRRKLGKDFIRTIRGLGYIISQ